MTRSKKYRPEIDGLRALAVVAVVLFHARVPFFANGYLGVDIFFVISGYLITTILISELDEGSFSLSRFYERRVRRIVPALIFVLLLTVPLAWTLMTPEDLKRYGQSMLSVLTMSSNMYFWKSTDYFSPNADEQPLLHTWSLSIEEQFYLVYPLTLLLVWRFGRNIGFMLVAAGALLSLVAWLLLSQRAPQMAFYLAPARAWELLAGGSLAFFMIPGRFSVSLADKVRSECLAALGFLLLALAVFGGSISHDGDELATIAAIAGTCLLIYAAGTRTLVGRLLSSKTLVGVGLVSYSAYLLHQPVFAYLRLADVQPISVPGKLAVVGLCFGSAYLCWRFVEEPFRSRKVRLRVLLLWVSSGAAVALLSGLALGFSKGLREAAVTSGYLEVDRSARSSPERGRCHSTGSHPIRPEFACVYGSAEPEVAVFGDSHAVELAYALGEIGAEHGKGVIHFSHSACAPSAPGFITHSGCEQWSEASLQHIAARSSVTDVVIAYRFIYHLEGGHEGVYPDIPRSLDHADARWNALVSIVEFLQKNGKRVTLVMQSPELPRHVKYIALRRLLSDGSAYGVDVDWWDRRSEGFRRRLLTLPSSVTVYDPSKLFCDNTRCKAVEDHKALYFDDDHVSVLGAQRIAGELYRLIDLGADDDR